jgi:hypothetical protein
MNSRDIMWTVHVTNFRREYVKSLVEIPERKNHVEDRGVRASLRNKSVKMWTGLISLRIGTGTGISYSHLWTRK